MLMKYSPSVEVELRQLDSKPSFIQSWTVLSKFTCSKPESANNTAVEHELLQASFSVLAVSNQVQLLSCLVCSSPICSDQGI